MDRSRPAIEYWRMFRVPFPTARPRYSFGTPRLSRSGIARLPVLFLLLAVAAPASAQAIAAGGGFADRIMDGCETDVRLVNQVSGWAVRWPGALEAASVGTSRDRTELLSYWDGAPAALERDVDALREGIRGRTTAPKAVVHRVLAQVDGLLALAPNESPLWSPARRSPDPTFRPDWNALVESRLVPAIRAYRAFLGGEYLEAARSTMGLGVTPGGAECFTRLIEAWTSLPLSPEEVEALGNRQLRILKAELLELAAPRYGATVPEILDGLRSDDLPDPFRTREDVVEHARAAIRRAEDEVGAWIGSPGRIPIRVEAMPRYLESSFPAGVYNEPGDDRIATYVVNTSRPAERRLLSEAIAFHEAIPGHHTHHSARPATDGAFVSGLAEGWAIYAERLADEMGLYSTDLDRIGLVTKHLWATSRLLVEPGLHLHGWSREDAVDFMLENTALPRDEIEVEVDRYPALAGQSLGYMLGNLHLRQLRDSAEERLGDRFDIRAFHDVILTRGMRPLPQVTADVEEWIESVARTGAAVAGPRPFAPGVLPTEGVFRGTFSADGREFYFFRPTGERDDYRIFVSRRAGSRDGSWSEPARVDLGGEHSDLYPTVSPDGEWLVFASYRAVPGASDDATDASLWVSRREGAGWGEPTALLGVTHLDRYESHPVIEADGRLSFRRALPDWSREDALIADPAPGGGWQEPRPDDRIERWRGWKSDLHLWGGLAHPSGELVLLDVSPVDDDGRRGPSDLWFSRRDATGEWSEPRPAEGGVNTDGWDNFPVFTPDGETVVYVRDFNRFLTIPLDVITGDVRGHMTEAP